LSEVHTEERSTGNAARCKRYRERKRVAVSSRVEGDHVAADHARVIERDTPPKRNRAQERIQQLSAEKGDLVRARTRLERERDELLALNRQLVAQINSLVARAR
jgi:hypothetical protein